ncbi:hypothetical protein NQ315_005056 [Exocentrus adspersus]|uniref:Uncharacterized protein n=1 Tax=Exocentrus adspersus TaxID=1586481 RepID=A0AAV8VQ93_9CUCU|nr:hypothetical protein NQ315_005056 [Exocentrus adspersus]
MDDRWPNIFIELNQLIISIISLIRIGKYLLVQKKKEWVTSDGNIGTLGTSFGLNWIFLMLGLRVACLPTLIMVALRVQ